MTFGLYNPWRMDISWHGMSCVSFKGKNATVVTDPYDSKETGLKLPKLSGEIFLANIDFQRHHGVGAFSKEGANVFDWPGEYEAKNIIVQAVAAFDRPREKESNKKDDAQSALIFSMVIDGFRICHLSNLGHKLTPEMIEAIGDVDILLVPVGGVGCLDAQKAHEVIEQLDPRVVIPMYYKIPGVTLPLKEIDAFIKEVGIEKSDGEKVWKLQSRSQLPQDSTEFKILEPVLG